MHPDLDPELVRRREGIGWDREPAAVIFPAVNVLPVVRSNLA